eukprot:4052508-Amphidinium_carterae.1
MFQKSSRHCYSLSPPNATQVAVDSRKMKLTSEDTPIPQRTVRHLKELQISDRLLEGWSPPSLRLWLQPRELQGSGLGQPSGKPGGNWSRASCQFAHRTQSA